MNMGGKAFQAEDRAVTKIFGCEHAYNIQGTSRRPPCLVRSEREGGEIRGKWASCAQESL